MIKVGGLIHQRAGEGVNVQLLRNSFKALSCHLAGLQFSASDYLNRISCNWTESGEALMDLEFFGSFLFQDKNEQWHN